MPGSPTSTHANSQPERGQITPSRSSHAASTSGTPAVDGRVMTRRSRSAAQASRLAHEPRQTRASFRRHRARNRSIAASSAALMPGSSAECPASGTIVSRARSHTAASAAALSGGQIMS